MATDLRTLQMAQYRPQEDGAAEHFVGLVSARGVLARLRVRRKLAP
ncbi:MAG: hypothetical protein WD314_14215 [Trueperaceae bacterium]